MEFATTPWAELHPGFCARGIGEHHPPWSPGYGWQEKQSHRPTSAKQGQLLARRGLLVCEAAARGAGVAAANVAASPRWGQAKCPWLIFPRDVTNNSNDAPGGYECGKARRGGSHAGHLVCGLPTEGTAANKTCWSQLCATRALLEGLQGRKGKMAARQTPLPRHPICLWWGPTLSSAKAGTGFLAWGEKWQKQSQRVPSPWGTETRRGREFGKAFQCFKAAPPQLLPLPSTRVFHTQMLP